MDKYSIISCSESLKLLLYRVFDYILTLPGEKKTYTKVVGFCQYYLLKLSERTKTHRKIGKYRQLQLFKCNILYIMRYNERSLYSDFKNISVVGIWFISF